MIKVGITGNIGSGKSTIAKLFALQGIPVYDADSRAKAIMVEDQQLISELIKHFGPETYFADATLNRAYLSQQVFNNPEKLKILNSIVHPAVFRDFNSWLNQYQGAGVPYILKEAALLVESGSYKDLDYLILVQADEEIRLQRSMARDAASAEAILARMKNQMPQESKVPFAQFFIQNNNDLLIPQVLEIHQELCLLSGKNV
ncbi:MAG: dephospho-CoA kinase [Bacteroidia bacterium]|nr:dephospho-CoA kinase [Bacteroidia bacterium]